jgi:hypothetical protein
MAMPQKQTPERGFRIAHFCCADMKPRFAFVRTNKRRQKTLVSAKKELNFGTTVWSATKCPGDTGFDRHQMVGFFDTMNFRRVCFLSLFIVIVWGCKSPPSGPAINSMDFGDMELEQRIRLANEEVQIRTAELEIQLREVEGPAL